MTSPPESAPDPRRFASAEHVPAPAAALYRLAEQSLQADTGQQADAADARLQAALAAALRGEGVPLAPLLLEAPSVAVARHLWRQLDAAWRATEVLDGASVAVTIFALPIAVVVGLEAARGEGTLGAVLPEPGALAAILRDHRALGGNETFTLGNALVAADAIDLGRLPELARWRHLPEQRPAHAVMERMLPPAPLAWVAGRESVHLRFLVGSAIARAGVDLLASPGIERWGMPLARELSRQLAGEGVSVLALPRPPERPLPAVWHGKLAQREVAAQLFASNAIRKLRSELGEPTAVISAHRTDEMQGGELRLSLSSPFAPREAEGFRCPLYPQDRVEDVVGVLTRLLRDCRVTDVRVIGGIHADRDAATGLPLLFKPGTIPPSTPGVH